MDKTDKIIKIIRSLKEEGMVTGSSSGTPGFSEKSSASGPTAGITPVMPAPKKKYAYGGTGSRKMWQQFLKNK